MTYALEHGDSCREIGALAASTHEVFLLPFESGQSLRCILLQNIGNTHPECMFDSNGEVLEAYNIPGILDDKGIFLCEVKDTRMIAPTLGNTIIKERVRIDPATVQADAAVADAVRLGIIGGEEAAIMRRIEAASCDYVTYLLRWGLLHADDLHNLLFTASFTDFDEILRKTATTGRTVVPYNPTPAFRELCNRYGIKTYGKTSVEVGRLNDKNYFRNLIEQLRPGTNKYPRSWYPAGAAAAVGDLNYLMEVSRAHQPGRTGPLDVLFIQKVLGGGGGGNYRVTSVPGGGFTIEGVMDFPDVDAVADFVGAIGASVEVSPFLPVVASPSFGIISSQSGVSCLGPFQQILNRDNDYTGFRLNASGGLGAFDGEVAALLVDDLPDIISLSEQLGRYAQTQGYIGYSSLDTFAYRDDQGKLRLAFSEQNLRYTGTCMLQMMIHKRPELRPRFLAGDLSIAHHARVPVSERVLSMTQGSTVGIALYLQARGIPLVGNNDGEAFGVILMAKPSPSPVGICVGIGVVAPTDHQRDLWLDAAMAALQ